MMWTTGESWKQHAGHPEQFVGTRVVRVIDGSGDGARLLQAWTPHGLELDIALDRGFDISRVRLRGMPVDWMGPTGQQPRYMQEPFGYGWLRTFQGGLVTTCGLDHIGAPVNESNAHNHPGGETTIHRGEHGRISYQSARLVGIEITEGPEAKIILTGTVRQASLYAECFELTRVIEISLYSGTIALKDSVQNVGSLPARHALLYHVNIGYPLVAEGSEIWAKSAEKPLRHVVGPLSPEATELVDSWAIAADPGHRSEVHLHNRGAGVQLNLAYSSDSLPEFLLWALQRTKNDVIGFAPSTGSAPSFMAADEIRTYDMTFTLTTDPDRKIT